MASQIKLLPESVANQIAAGEVVNRPASVVKEMMENAVDAGSSNITVCFSDGGKGYLRIIDDGSGMIPADARMAFERHATSKIDTVEDIYSLRTFGFRGEALASIASVAEVELKTRTADQEIGTQVEISGGKFISQGPVSCPVGSQFMVRNLFYNVPARRRFLDKSSTESRHISGEYQRIALCNPGVGFSLYDGDTLVSRLEPGTLRQRIAGVTGKNRSRHLLEISADTSIIKLEGFTGRPESAGKTNREQFLFVNGRYFKSPYFHKAVLSAYDKLIQPGTQPSYFLYLTIDPVRIDVNVHPQKTEVKFSDGSDIWQIVNAAVRESLARSGAVPAFDFDIDAGIEIPVARERAVYPQPRITANPEFNPFEKYGDEIQLPVSESMLPEPDLSPGDAAIAGRRGNSGTPEARKPVSGYMYMDGMDRDNPFEDDSLIEFVETGGVAQGELGLGQDEESPVMLLDGRHMVTVINGNLTVIDIPRAHETVLYDRFMFMLGNNTSVSQQLLFPETIALSLDDLGLIKEFGDDFAAFGFDIEISGENEISVRGVPADFTDLPVEQLIYDLLDSMKEGTAGDMRRRRAASALASIGSMARSRTADIGKLEELKRNLLLCENHSYTPAGRKVMALFYPEDIRKKLD